MDEATRKLIEERLAQYRKQYEESTKLSVMLEGAIQAMAKLLEPVEAQPQNGG